MAYSFRQRILASNGGNIAQTWPLRVSVGVHYVAICVMGYLIWHFLGAEIRRCQQVVVKLKERVEYELKALEQAPTILVTSTPSPRAEPGR